MCVTTLGADVSPEKAIKQTAESAAGLLHTYALGILAIREVRFVGISNDK
jgi:hypothetical protein